MDSTTIASSINALQTGLDRPANDRLKAATEEFEGMFLSYLLKVMRSTVQSEEEGELSMGKDLYTEMFDSEIALSIARTRSLGIGEMIFRQLQENNQSTPALNGTTTPEPIPAVETEDASGSPTPMALPVEGYLSSPFGFRTDPINGSIQFHKGVDIAASEGTPFRAANAGSVVFAGVLNGYGNTVVIEHDGGTRTLYGHASQILVKAGDTVIPGQPVGIVGKTGRSTGPHLHFETLVGGQQIDPQTFVAIKDLDKVSGPTHR